MGETVGSDARYTNPKGFRYSRDGVEDDWLYEVNILTTFTNSEGLLVSGTIGMEDNIKIEGHGQSFFRWDDHPVDSTGEFSATVQFAGEEYEGALNAQFSNDLGEIKGSVKIDTLNFYGKFTAHRNE